MLCYSCCAMSCCATSPASLSCCQCHVTPASHIGSKKSPVLQCNCETEAHQCDPSWADAAGQCATRSQGPQVSPVTCCSAKLKPVAAHDLVHMLYCCSGRHGDTAVCVVQSGKVTSGAVDGRRDQQARTGS